MRSKITSGFYLIDVGSVSGCVMDLDVVCSSCQGRVILAADRAVVACPHCGTDVTVSGEADPCAVDQQVEPAEPDESALPASAVEDATCPAAFPNLTSVSDAPGDRENSAGEARPGDVEQIPKLKYQIAVSYAGVMTIVCIVLLLLQARARTHQLESLPDLKPAIKEGAVAFQLVPEEAPMPPGHTLAIGEHRRFGNLQVRPIKVTRGPVQFVHYTGKAGQQRAPTAPVLKLWIEFENVSPDQVFAPLDRELMLTRVPDKNSDRLRANNFVCRSAEKRRQGHRVLLYDISKTSDWEFKEQNIGFELRPGETILTYLATDEEGLDRLKGDLLWRVHFRKGYHPASLCGVTTLIEVAFSSDQVINESG